MTGSTDTNGSDLTVEPMRPLPPAQANASVEPDAVTFQEHVRRPAGQTTAVRIGIVAGSALLFVVGAVAVMGASPTPSTGAGPAASTAPGSSEAPEGSEAPEPPGTAGKGPWRLGPGFGHGERGGIGFGAITITAINGSDVSLKTDDGWTRTIAVTSTTAITKAGATIALGDLAVGDQVRFAEQKAADGSYTITALAVVLPTTGGKVTAVSGDTITVTRPDGSTATIHVAAGTTYKVNGAAGSLADIKVGSFIAAEGTLRADGSLDASAVHVGVGGHGFKGPGGRPGDRDDPGAIPAPGSASPAPSGATS